LKKPCKGIIIHGDLCKCIKVKLILKTVFTYPVLDPRSYLELVCSEELVH
jgi:hypothetical protein